MPGSFQPLLDQALTGLCQALGDNLFSCCVYGSAVRGNLIEGVSDINLLIVLKESTPAAHQAIAGVLHSHRQIDPFVLGRSGFERSVLAFAPKFSSIKRNYRVLHGPDLLAEVKLDPRLEKFLCEQSLRNLRLRLVYAFVTRHQEKTYDRFLARSVTPLFVRLGEILRLEGIAVPKDFNARVSLFEKEFKVDGEVLRDLLAFKAKPEKLFENEINAWHERVFPVLDQTLAWVEAHWPAKPF